MSHAFKLTNDTILLSVESPGGIYNAAQLKLIATLCDGKTGIVRVTEDQRISIAVKPELVNELSDQLATVGLGIRHYQSGLHGATSCIGSLCPDAEQDALSSAMDLNDVLTSTEVTSKLKIGINGCAKCCVPCHTLDLSIVGDSSGYRLCIGGKNSQLPEFANYVAEGIPASELPTRVKSVIDTYNELANDVEESLQDVIDRVGAGPFITVLSPYSQDAAGGSESQDEFGSNVLESSEDSSTNDVVSNDDDGVLFESPMDESVENNEAIQSMEPEADGSHHDLDHQDESPLSDFDSSVASDIDPKMAKSDNFEFISDEISILSSDEQTPEVKVENDSFHSEDDQEFSSTHEAEDLSLQAQGGAPKQALLQEATLIESYSSNPSSISAEAESLELDEIGSMEAENLDSDQS
ncbi:MAG: hypothetical protein NT027_15465, partial [Proteobacteria bacterium]|nr:hypothetical protein [Pseudomonadota bacterium]